ncbi:MAG: hypothetical protein B7733_07940 [Myxococcales bacterium FL481]|nr:MAG: hypothetical protein B7733_07940 [Myxococcales bacterium FL481]
MADDSEKIRLVDGPSEGLGHELVDDRSRELYRRDTPMLGGCGSLLTAAFIDSTWRTGGRAGGCSYATRHFALLDGDCVGQPSACSAREANAWGTDGTKLDVALVWLYCGQMASSQDRSGYPSSRLSAALPARAPLALASDSGAGGSPEEVRSGRVPARGHLPA